MPQEHPWTSELMDRLHQDVTQFYKVYYHELHWLASEVDYETLPRWVKGKRVVYVKLCLDGVVIAHMYPDRMPAYKPPREDDDGDLFKFSIFFDQTVARRFIEDIPLRKSGERFPVPYAPVYQDGTLVGSHVIETPLELVRGSGHAEQMPRRWTRLEWASLELSVGERIWQDTSLAEAEARRVLNIARHER